MGPVVLPDSRQRPDPTTGFRPRVFRRMVGLVRPYLRTLLLALVVTLLFASMHALSIGGAFPIFKVLLETEGLRGWADRTVAGDRLGIEFAPLTEPQDQNRIRVVRVRESSEAYAAGLRAFDTVSDPQGRPVIELLHEIAWAPPNGAVNVEAGTPGGEQQPEQVRRVTLRAEALELKARLLRWGASIVPADTSQEKLRTLTYLLTGLVIAIVIANIFRYWSRILIAKAVLRAMLNLRASLYERTLRLPMAYFSTESPTGLVSHYVQDIQEIQRGLNTLLGKVVQEPIRTVFILGLALTLDWRITLTMLVLAPIVVAVFWLVGRTVKFANRKLLVMYGQMIGALTATLQNLRIVKVCTAEQYERARLSQIDRRMFRQQVRLAKLEELSSPLLETLAVIAGSMITVWLASRVLAGDLSPSRFVALGFILSVLFDPLRKLSDVYVRVLRATAGAERVFHMLDSPVETTVAGGDLELKPLQRSIEFANVTFTYPGANAPALDEIDLELHKGETIAIVGPNGSGKTTLVSMLPRFFDPDTGRVLYDGVDIREATLASLRRQIGLVTQEAVIFAGTPTENIAYGDPAPDVQRVRWAAQRASADEFIQELPGGYEAKLGERGATLSGGQRQRLAIARAIYRDTPVIIFDEATSQVDSESERRIQDALREITRGRTTLIVAHRLSTIQFADRVVVMDAGRIIDSGSHAELFTRCDVYRNLCERQFVRQMASTHVSPQP